MHDMQMIQNLLEDDEEVHEDVEASQGAEPDFANEMDSHMA